MGKKGKTYSPIQEDMKQSEYKDNPRMNYSAWYEEVITGTAEQTQRMPGYMPCAELLKPGQTDGHHWVTISLPCLFVLPPRVCEPTTSHIMRVLLKTNAGIQVSKLINLYSRLGGAYQSNKVFGEELFKNIAIIPILATLSRVGESNDEDVGRVRLLSGVRAPYHARRPTDRINFLTIETLKNNDTNKEFVKFLNNALVFHTSTFLIVMRQNSVMKIPRTMHS